MIMRGYVQQSDTDGFAFTTPQIVLKGLRKFFSEMISHFA